MTYPYEPCGHPAPCTPAACVRRDPIYRVERIEVPEHVTHRFTGGGWVFTQVRTGCIRVQRGDFTAYIPPEIVEGLTNFIDDHYDRIVKPMDDLAEEARLDALFPDSRRRPIPADQPPRMYRGSTE